MFNSVTFAEKIAQPGYRMMVAILELHAAGTIAFLHPLLDVLPISRMDARRPFLRVLGIVGVGAKDSVQIGRQRGHVPRRVPFPGSDVGSGSRSAKSLLTLPKRCACGDFIFQS